ncbi:hypothetical protein PK23_004520 [Salmonella enterica subsp. enterica]|nr:hypothetical protein [Salmonella enterica subsp. enterica serovar Javiana]
MSFTRELYKLGFEISPVILCDGIAQSIPGGNGSVIQQILPTFYVNRLQQQFSKYFSSLQIALADVDPPVYNISAITNSGSKIVAQVYI